MHVFLLALAPSLFWLWWFWSREKLHREHPEVLARIFVFGAFSTIIVAITEFLAGFAFGRNQLAALILIVGPCEEIAKFIATSIAVKNEKTFDEPLDGVVFAASASLGFAFAENLFYFSSLNPTVFTMRSLLTVPGHVLCAVPWGAAMGCRHFAGTTTTRLMINGLLLSSLLHSLFDALSDHVKFSYFLMYGAIVLLILLEFRFYKSTTKKLLLLGRKIVRDRNQHNLSGKESRPPKKPVKTKRQGNIIKLRWLGFSTGLALILSFLGTALIDDLRHHFHMHISKSSEISGLLFLLFCSGLVSARMSPGNTVKESCLGLVIAALIIGFSLKQKPFELIMMTIVFGWIGIFSGWLGEQLQSQQKRK